MWQLLASVVHEVCYKLNYELAQPAASDCDEIGRTASDAPKFFVSRTDLRKLVLQHHVETRVCHTVHLLLCIAGSLTLHNAWHS